VLTANGAGAERLGKENSDDGNGRNAIRLERNPVGGGGGGFSPNPEWDRDLLQEEPPPVDSVYVTKPNVSPCNNKQNEKHGSIIINKPIIYILKGQPDQGKTACGFALYGKLEPRSQSDHMYNEICLIDLDSYHSIIFQNNTNNMVQRI
jgi:hypothetical protein